MTFVQEYTRKEKYFGSHTLRFVVSDTFEDLFKESHDAGDGLAVDIFQTDKWTQRLENDDGTQGVDDLPFTMDYTLCRTENEKNCYYFVLEAQSVTNNRFCAFMFDPTYTGGVADESCIWFIGKIHDKFSGTDLKWSNDQYAKNISPLRVRKGNSYSFGIAIFDKIKLFGLGTDNRITLPDASTTEPLMHAKRIDHDTEIPSIFAYRLAYGNDDPGSPAVRKDYKYTHYAPLGNLYDILNLLFDHAEDIIYELINTSITLSLQESSLGIQTSYLKYILEKNKEPWISDIEIDDEKRTLLKISSTESGIDADTGLHFSTIFLNRRMVNPYWHDSEKWRRGLHNDEQYENIDDEDGQMAFIQYNNLTDLLHQLAKTLKCYLRVVTKVTGDIEITFVPKEAIVEADQVFLSDQVKASINTGSVMSDEPNEYFCLSTLFSVDGKDIIVRKFFETIDYTTEDRKAEAEKRKLKKDLHNIESEKLLLSTSWTFSRMKTEGDQTQPATVFTVPFNTIWSKTIKNEYGFYNDNRTFPGNSERLHTAIYIKTKPVESDQITRLGAYTDIWRPATKLFVNYDGEDREFNTLEDLINNDAESSVQYYENTYEITVPFWSAFSNNSDGSSPSWDNLKIGSKVVLNEVVRMLSGSSWIEYLAPTDTVFTVTEISRNTNYPETKIKLLNISKFAYNVWSGSVNSLTALNYSFDNHKDVEYLLDGISVKQYTIAAGETVDEGDAVMVLADRTIKKVISHHNYRGLIKGIALESGDGDDIEANEIAVQLKGIVYIEDWDFSGYESKQLFARTNATGTTVTTELLDDPTDDEDLIIYLGEIEGEHSLVLDIHEYKLEEKLWQKSY